MQGLPNDLPPEMQQPQPQLTGTDPMNAIPGEPQQEIVGDDKRQELLDMIEQIKGKVGQSNATRFAMDNMVNSKRSDALQQIFMLMQEAGVDLADPQSVAEFIAKIREVNPDMAMLFEEIMDQLLGGEPKEMSPEMGGMEDIDGMGMDGMDEMPQEMGASRPGDLKMLRGIKMSPNEDLQQTVRGPVPEGQ